MIKATVGNLLIEIGGTTHSHGLISNISEYRAKVIDDPLDTFTDKHIYFCSSETDIEVAPNILLIDRMQVKGWDDDE